MYQMMKLKYDYDALEPILDREIVDLHYNKHYKNYLDKLNNLLNKNNFIYNMSKENLIKNLQMFEMEDRGEILYNLGGVINHELYFNSMTSPSKYKKPSGKIESLINKTYGSYETFIKEFKQKANNLKGSGYTFLTLDKNNLPLILNTSNQDSPLYYGFKPILALDLWEHAYYLQYKNNRQEYIDNFINIIDYDNVNKEIDKYIK